MKLLTTGRLWGAYGAVTGLLAGLAMAHGWRLPAVLGLVVAWGGAVIVMRLMAARRVRRQRAEDAEYREYETAFGWDRDQPLTEVEQDDVG